jgi:hypothetical protein
MLLNSITKYSPDMRRGSSSLLYRAGANDICESKNQKQLKFVIVQVEVKLICVFYVIIE